MDLGNPKSLQFRRPLEALKEKQLVRPYQNPQIEAELEEQEFVEEQEKVLKQPADTPEDNEWKKRYGDLRRHQQEREAELKAEMETLKRQMESVQQGKIRPPKSEAELSEWEEAYPDFAQIMDARVDRRIDSKIGDLKVQSKEIEKEKALIKLKKKHPDAEDIFSSPDFHDWLKNQSKIEQDYIYKSYDVDNASFILEKFKALSKNAPRDEDGSDGARAVKTKNTIAISDDGDDYEYSESQIERETKKNPRWWDANEDKVLTAMRKGKVKLDMTGGAR